MLIKTCESRKRIINTKQMLEFMHSLQKRKRVIVLIKITVSISDNG